MITKTGSAKWEGGLKEGKGEVSSQSGALSGQPYGFNTRFEDKPGTNPEELVGAAHASCFSMALAMMLEQEGISGVAIQTTSEISMDKEGDGFAVKKAHLKTSITADADEAKVMEIADKAKAGCPISKLLNAEITMDAKMA
ncbi:OsmC family protein [Paracoccus sp. 1_MG-2023]|uniref:OsmC family protein n=1 Tax=unclassified Paracoccus (in: a-proteobacteria) TaxID=2688777 RepID=UPI001C097FC0|nr:MULTISPECIES: OsmC family protein [unclassified Paracoccus (in: a-proteobacteria)]MBU2956536.1 OsmC family protein [Paracoccus sp. C2R09]MDO6668642.1 OsmC family protein [Paracoccus sp. 1_MG-2023]